MTKFKYNIIAPLLDVKTGIIDPAKEQPWTGTFENEQAADQWYEKFGKDQESRGKKLVRRAVANQEKAKE